MDTVHALRESLTGGRVVGSIVHAHRQWVREHYGDQALLRILSVVPAEAAMEVTGALPSKWCAFESLIHFDKAIAYVSGQDELELMRSLGRYTAETSVSRVDRTFRRDAVHELFRRSATVHAMLHDFGRCEYEQVAAAQGRMRVRDAVCFSPTWCHGAAGYFEQLIAIHGGSAPSVTETTCRCAGDPSCTYELRWR